MRWGALLLVAGCVEAPVESVRERIVGGTMDGGDPAVGAVLLQQRDGVIRGICTGTLIAPRVVLTAAHCVKIDNPQLGGVEARSVYFGTALNGNGYIALGEVVRRGHHPGYDGSVVDDGTDVGLLLLREAPPIEPVAINRAPIEGMEGDPLRLVGFGTTSAQRDDDGLKREVTTTIDAIDASFLWIYSSRENTCNGDSGGPVFVDLGDGEVVAGVTSVGDEGCTQVGGYVRVDAHAAAFIDPWIAANDVPGVPGPEDEEPEVDPGCSVGRGAGAWPLVALLWALSRRRHGER